jgi:hypothetical protein
VLPSHALTIAHAGYISGQHAYSRKWYFAAQLHLDDAMGHTQNPGLRLQRSQWRGSKPNPSEVSCDSHRGHGRYESIRSVATNCAVPAVLRRSSASVLPSACASSSSAQKTIIVHPCLKAYIFVLSSSFLSRPGVGGRRWEVCPAADGPWRHHWI